MNAQEILRQCEEKDRIYIYGAGEYGKTVCRFLMERDVCIRAFVVSETTICNRIMGKPICSWGEYRAARYSTEDLIIVCMDEKYHPVVRCNTDDVDASVIFLKKYELAKIEEFTQFDTKMSDCVFALVYHRVIDLDSDVWNLSISPGLFEKQIVWLKNRFNIASPMDYNIRTGDCSVIITFDDGYYDFYKHVLPIITKHEVPVTVFLSTLNIDTCNEFWWDEIERLIYLERDVDSIVVDGETYRTDSVETRTKCCYDVHSRLKKMSHEDRAEVLSDICKQVKAPRCGRDSHRQLSSTEIKGLSENPFVTIGGHTVTHSCLANQSIREQKWEVVKSKSDIESIIDKEIETFSYPFGQFDDYSSETKIIVERAGYQNAFSAFPGVIRKGNDPFEYQRINVSYFQSENDIIKELRKRVVFDVGQ